MKHISYWLQITRLSYMRVLTLTSTVPFHMETSKCRYAMEASGFINVLDVTARQDLVECCCPNTLASKVGPHRHES